MVIQKTEQKQVCLDQGYEKSFNKSSEALSNKPEHLKSDEKQQPGLWQLSITNT